MGKGAKVTARVLLNNQINNDHIGEINKENLKRVNLFFDRITNMNKLPYAQSLWISEMKSKAQLGCYFIVINLNGDIIQNDSQVSDGQRHVVDWLQIAEDMGIQLDGLSSEGFDVTKFRGKILEEIHYESERQGMSNIRNERGKTVNVKPYLQHLLDRNSQPMFTGKWKKEAYARRQYDPISDYVPTNSIDACEGNSLLESLNTNLDGYIGPAYNYDDQRLTEDWMLSFQDSLVSRLSESEFVRIQLESLMEMMISRVQDQVCNELGSLSREPVGLGPRLLEKPVWGIDSHSVKTMQLILEDYYWKSLGPACLIIGNASTPDHFSTDEYKRFLERTLLPTINSVPTAQAHSMKVVLETIRNSTSPQLHRDYAATILASFSEVDPNSYFRIHPKGTGVICIDPSGIDAHTVIAEYLGELFPPYRWCEKLDAIQQAQRSYELKPTLPDFYNILLERPRKDQRGYGLLFVDASQRANLGSSCSHSCDANCTSAVVARNGKLCIVLTTNRYIFPGEELCMDYYSITTSEIEWRSSICFCGSLSCRGTFLHYAAQEELQQILSRSCGPAWRVATLLRGCAENSVTDHDLAVLRHHGIGDIALNNSAPSWLKRYAIDTIRFLEYERKALPCALLRSQPVEFSSDSKDNLIQSQYTYVSADCDARSVLEQRMQSLLCSFSLITKYLSKQDPQLRSRLPLKILPLADAISRIWSVLKTIPSLLKKHLIQSIPKSQTENSDDTQHDIHSEPVHSTTSKKTILKEKLQTLQAASKKINEIVGDKNSIPVSLSSLRQCIKAIRQIVISIQHHSTPTARLSLLADVLAMWSHTSNFVEIQEYQAIHSDPIRVVARELGTTTIAKDKLEKFLEPTSILLQTQKLERAESDSVSEHSDVESNLDVVAEEDKSGSASKSLRGGRKRKVPAVSLNPNDIIFTGRRTYSPTYIFWQLIGWYNAGTEQENDQPDLLGTCFLPAPSACFGYSRKDYTPVARALFLEHWSTDKTLSQPFPPLLRHCFSDTSNNVMMLGSPVLDVGLGQVDAVEDCLKDIFGSLKRKTEEFGQYDLNLPPERPTAWVQCEKCLKWRRVPFHVNVENLPEQWYCEQNTWDLEKANCAVPQDKFDSEKEATLLTDCTEIEPVNEGDWKDVYCLRNEVYYEAKAMKFRTVKGKDGEEITEIKFHFKGWKSSQDEWIELGSERIAPHHLYTDVTSRSVRDQEKWQGLAPITLKSKGIKRKGNVEKVNAKKSKNIL